MSGTGRAKRTGGTLPRTARGPSRHILVLMAYLAALPRTGLFLGALVVALAGLFLPGVAGAVILFAIAVVLVAVLGVTWRRLLPARRILQVFVLLLLVVLIVTKLR